MRNSATHSGKELVKEIARLQTQLEDVAETVNASGGEVAEDSLRSARELIAKYGDTAKSMADEAINFKETVTPVRPCSGGFPHGLRRPCRWRHRRCAGRRPAYRRGRRRSDRWSSLGS